LARTLEVGIEDGALGALVSGSGPSVVFLVENSERALDLSIGLAAAGVCRDVVRATGPVPGARLVEVR
jgi:4-diphosphocytidyl-2-C-methyl-D-erythritol kinase